MKFLIIFSILFAIASCQPPSGSWNLTFYEDWSDGFSQWLIDDGTCYPGGSPQWGTNEVEIYVAESLIMTTDNALSIVPQLSASGVWTSARIETIRDDFACAAGGMLWIEAIIMLPDVPEDQMQGVWPAFWALGTQFRGNYLNWPMVSEWDILENINGLPTLYTTCHCGIDPGGPCNEDDGIGSSVAFTRGVWHTVSFQVNRNMTGPGGNGTWLDETLSWFLDGTLVFSVNGARINSLQDWTQLASAPHFLLLNVAVGGSFPDAIAAVSTPNAATVSGVSMMEVLSVGVWNSLPI